jgi:hypothetical protein
MFEEVETLLVIVEIDAAVFDELPPCRDGRLGVGVAEVECVITPFSDGVDYRGVVRAGR